MFEQTVLLGRLAHLKAKLVIKNEELVDQSLPGLADIQSGVQRKILAAIAKIEKSPEIYGICEDCGEPIPLKRLESVPEAQFCLDCACKEDERDGKVAKFCG